MKKNELKVPVAVQEVKVLTTVVPGEEWDGEMETTVEEDCDAAPDPQTPRLQKNKLGLLWPRTTQLETPAAKYQWFVALLTQHPETNLLFKEGRNVPYITLDNGPVCDRLVTEGFQGEVMVPIKEFPKTVIIHGVPTYVSVTSLDTPQGFLSLRRRYVAKTPRPQLLGTVQGSIPENVWISGVGRKRVTLYIWPDLCQRCSKWGHKEWRCWSSPRCRYCAGRHHSNECMKKIQKGVKFTPRCCNCGGPHNASSNACPEKRTPFSGTHGVQQESFIRQHVTPVYRHTLPLAHNAWDNTTPRSGPHHPPKGPGHASSPVTAGTAGSHAASAPGADPSYSILLDIQKEVATITTRVGQCTELLTTIEARLATRAQCPSPGMAPVDKDDDPHLPSLSSDNGPQHQEAAGSLITGSAVMATGTSPNSNCSAQPMGASGPSADPSRLDRLEAMVRELVDAINDLTRSVNGMLCAQQRVRGG